MSSLPLRLFHFADPADWARAQAAGEYVPSGFDREGFIHAATTAQSAGVIERHLRGHGPRVQLELDARMLGDTLHWEWSTASGDLYPHIHAAIPLSAVLDSALFDPDRTLPATAEPLAMSADHRRVITAA